MTTSIDPNIALIQPRLSLQQEFLQYCDAFQAANEPDQYLEELAYQDFPQYIQKLKDAELGIGIPTGWVPSSTYWLVRDDQFILGNSSLRHFLTPSLEDIGGHIGYRIHPLERGKGYGTLILKLTLEKARLRGLSEVLVTCNTDNIASARVIQNNGGVLASQGTAKQFPRPISRYWITL